MADKKEYPAQEVQQAKRPIENGCQQEQETDPRKIMADLYAKIQEIEVLLNGGSNPDRIAHCYKSAAADARRIAELTGMEKYLRYAEQLEQGAEFSPLMEQTAEIDPNQYVFTPDGKMYILPEQAEEYMQDNPIASKFTQEEQEPAAQEVREITIDIPPVDPKLDPSSPEFDIEAWKAALDVAGGMEAARERMEAVKQHLQQTIISSTNKMLTPSVGQLVAEDLQRTVTNAIKGISAFINSDAFKTISESMRLFSSFVTDNRELIINAVDGAEHLQPLVPFLQQEIDELKAQDPAFSDLSLSELLENGIDENGNPTGSKWAQLVERAKQRKADFEAAQELAEQAAAIQRLTEDLPILQSIVPKSHTMPNNALMNALQNGVKHKDGTPATAIINAGEFDLPVLPANKRRSEITSYTMVSYDENRAGITLTGAKLTEYERQVSDAFITLWLYGDESKIMTSDMIYRAMTGTTGKAPAGQKGAITKVMKKFEGLRITVDATEEMQKRGITDASGKPIKKVWFDEFYINTRRINVKMNGETVTAWQILSKPVILSYSEMTGQLLTVPAKLLDIKEISPKSGLATTVSLSNNDARIAIKGYLLRAIQVMKNKKRNKLEWSNIISFDKLFTETETTTDNRAQKKDFRDYIFSCLEYWKAVNHIAGYKKRTGAKNAITGVEIIL